MKIVTRFAPSPTGDPHVGNIRTAIFAYLWAKHNKGKFLLRIEDTDRERLAPKSLESIEKSLKWLGLNWDDEKIFQSDRKEVHNKYANKLLKEGKAYKCFCTKERLEELRKEQTERRLPPGYDKHCRNLNTGVIEKHEKNGDSYVIRYAMPESGRAGWEDGVRGKMEIDFSVSDDFVLIKSDGWPTYNFANVIDDHEMGVTDVIRGEEFIPSTPKHISLYKSFGWEHPRFSHMPHINGPSGSKLSKRDGDTAILDYRDSGYLPEAMLNFLATLGWNDGTEKEIFSRDELIKSFSIYRITKAPAVFDIKKLDWINGQYIRSASVSNLKSQISKLIPNSKLIKLRNFDQILEIEKSRLSKLTDITENTDFYHKIPTIDKSVLVFKKSTPEATRRGLEASLKELAAIEEGKWSEMSVDDFSTVMSNVVEKNRLSNGDVFWPVRYSLSGLEKSPSPPELMWALGKIPTINRLKKAIRSL